MTDFDIDLTEAELFADSARGVYIPQHFAEAVSRDHVEGVSDADYAALEAGPDADLYWDTWDAVLDNAVLTYADGRKGRLYQDGDLWIIPG